MDRLTFHKGMLASTALLTVPPFELFPAEPLAPGLNLTGVMLLPPLSVPTAFRELPIDDEKTIHFHPMVPLTTDEMQLKLDQGAEALFDGFEKHAVNELLDVTRASTIQRRASWFNFWRKG